MDYTLGTGNGMLKMDDRMPDDGLTSQSKQCFTELVQSTGVKRFSQSLGVTTRQVNRMLSGAQPNPVERMIRCLQSADPTVGDRALEFICQEMGGHFVRGDALNEQTVNAVSECAREVELVCENDSATLDVKQLRESIRNLSQAIESLRFDDDSPNGDAEGAD